jgi:hypothetical protein
MKGKMRVFGSIYSPSEPAVVYAQVFNENDVPVSTATVTLSLLESDGTKFLDSVAMTYIQSSNGLYKYAFTAPTTIKRLVADVHSTNPTAYCSEDIYVPQMAIDIRATSKVYVRAGGI